MELYCIKTDRQKVLVEGKMYPMISDKCPCTCKRIDVGVRDNTDINGLHIEIGELGYCSVCKYEYKFDGIYWFLKEHFANIDDINIEEAIETLETKELVNV